MGSLERSIRQSRSPASIAGSTRSRNSVLRWKDHARSTVAAAVNTPCRRRACAAPCRSPAQTSSCERTSHRSFYLMVRLRVPLSPTLGDCVIPVSSAVLHASLSSALLSLRQVDISSALGMNALQSLSTWGVHAKRCSGVPCEKEGAGDAVADSKASNTHHRAKGFGRSIQCFRLFMFIIGLAFMVEADTRHRRHGRWKYTLAGGCACSETSAFGASDPFTALLLPFDKRGRPIRPVSPSTSGVHKPPSHRASVQALGRQQR